ncbi:MAG: DUF2752 domain-containing protein [Alphaproteobacteria bacterium]|nr:DUF2752 domain-containing protein [Alphaproteobacteria bacterium]
MMARLGAFADFVTDFVTSRTAAWWVWPVILVGLAVLSDGLSLFFQPMGAEWVAFPNGERFGDTCAMIVTTGQPCPQCGMTRAWVHGVRLDLVSAFLYSPAGLALLAWINAGGIVGIARLVTRNPRRLEPPAFLLLGWVMVWLFPLYIGTWLLRMFGVNPLP